MKASFMLAPVLLAGLLAAGCQSPHSVVFVTTTGINLEASTASGTESTAHVGFNRFEGVIMPGRNPDGSPRKKAFPVFSAMDFSTGSLLLPTFSVTNTGTAASMRLHQVFATGRAATGTNSIKSIQKDYRFLTGKIATSAQAQSLQEWHAGLGASREEQLRRNKIVVDWLKSKDKASDGGAVTDFLEKVSREGERAQFIADEKSKF